MRLLLAISISICVRLDCIAPKIGIHAIEFRPFHNLETRVVERRRHCIPWQFPRELDPVNRVPPARFFAAAAAAAADHP
eukprot:scaffold130327_cov40-Attheya_sp.AAC.1